jgi:hypothetical protein
MIGLRRLRISSNLLVSFFLSEHEIYRVTANGLPDDARIVGVSHDLASGLIDLTLASASWDGPIDCAKIPELPPVFFDVGGVAS